MPHNLFVSYDLNDPGQSYDKVAKAIKELGAWAKVQMSFWYVSSDYSAKQACQHIWKSMDSNDSLTVVDATTNDAFWFNVSPEAQKQMQVMWRRLAA